MYIIITIILFFIYLWGLGFSATYFVKKTEDFWERHLMNLGIGLGIFAILSILLNFLHIPLDWKIFLILSIIIPIYDLIKRIKKKELSLSNLFNFSNFKLTKLHLILFCLLIIFSVTFYMYAKGSFAYPYLEDEDPWGHAIGIKYVSLEKTAYDPSFKEEWSFDKVLSYIDPYPPAYDVFFGILHQTSPNLNWTMKFFNALIISLGFIFFFFFARQFIENGNKALFATFILAAIPCYLSHFIWAHALVITLFFPTMYAFERIRKDKNWMFVALILVAAIWVSQNLDQPIKITTMILLYLVIVSVTQKKFFTKGFIALFGGLALSFVWWGAIIQKYGINTFLSYYDGSYATSSVAPDVTSNVTTFIASKGWNFFGLIIKQFLNPGGTGSRAYTFNDFFIAKSQNMINNPIGVGAVVSLLALIGLVFILWRYRSSIVENNNTWLCVTLFWLIFTFWGVNGITFPVSVARGAFRVWMLMAIPLSLIAAEGFYLLIAFFKSKLFRLAIILVVVIGIILTSGQQKYELNTSIWPTTSAFNSPQEAFEYGAWFKTLPDNTKVFIYTSRSKIILGFGMYTCPWCSDELEIKDRMIDVNAKELYDFLKSKDYEFLLLSIKNDLKDFKIKVGEEKSMNKLQEKYNEIINSGLFEPVYQKEGVFIALKIK